MEWGKGVVGDEAIWAVDVFKRWSRAIKGQLVLENIALFGVNSAQFSLSFRRLT